MKDFKKVIKEALTPHYLRESINEDFTHSSLAITDQSQISGLDNSELLDLLNKVSYEYTPELKNSARIISQEIEDRDLTNKIHYVDNERYEFMESVNETKTKTESELKDSWRKWNKKHPKDQIDWNEYREEHGEHLDEVTKEEIDDIENSGNIDIAYKKAMKLLNSLKDESVNESNWEKKLSKKAVHVDDDVYKKNKAQLQAAVKAYNKAESEGDIRGMELALAAVDMLKDESVNEDIVDDKAKMYWLQKLKSGEIDTLPDNPRMEYLRHAMRDQLAQDKEQLSRERGEMSGEEEHEHVKNLLKRNFMDEAEARVDEIDMNDPALMKARASKMADEKEKAKQADLKQKEDFKKTYLNKKYGSSFMDKLEAEIGLKSELQDLKDEREMLMIDMEQEAEPEGGEIADRYGSRLNKIDARMELIQKDIDDLRMYESVNEGGWKTQDNMNESVYGSVGFTPSDKDSKPEHPNWRDLSAEEIQDYIDANPNTLWGRSLSIAKMVLRDKKSEESINEDMGEWPKELTSRYSDEYRFELEKVSPTYQDKPGRAKYRVIDIESGELKGTPVFEKPESLMAYADDLIKPQGGTQSSHFGTNEGTCGYGEDGKIGKKPAGPIDEFFGNRDEENRRRRKRQAARASDKTANYHDLLKYYQYGIARIPRHKREKAGIPQAMHDRYGQEVWDILKKEYPNKGLSDTPSSDWRDSVDELIMSFGDERNFKETIFNPFYDIYAKLGPTDSHKKQLGIEEESDTDVGGGAKQAIGLDIDDEGASDAALDSEVNKMGYAESKEFNFKKMIKEALTPDYLK
tara:strand:+ start:5783 stop:8191 length:2409 start_codon:yes stop_codon:yes gene_type:complete